ncbi:MBL fold metallo-hydrolase [Paucibacter sp. O1-1]|nr:MBL fold metallo-hydrolase [Paucibacter sp. O1-1]MDA3825685.1 MBL fold metallo-hydrolase [Paucibacter sp. O1-1]
MEYKRKKTMNMGLSATLVGTMLLATACGGGSDDEEPVTDRFPLFQAVPAEPAYPTQYDRHLAAASLNAGADQELKDTWLKYYCMYPENNQTLRNQVRDDNARLPVTQIFDDVWYVGSRYVGQFVFKSSTGFLLLDALNNAAEVQQYAVPALTTLGVTASLPVKDLLLTHGHGDHDGGALELKTLYGPRVLLGSADAAGKTYAPFVIDSNDPNPVRMTLGGRNVTLLSTPGHTPGSVTSILPALDKGKEVKIMVVGGSAMPSTIQQANNYLDGVERSYRLAKAEGVVASVHPHPVFDGTQRNLVAINASGMPASNPFVIGNERLLRATAILRQCSAANKVKVDATVTVPVWRVTKLELPTDGPRVNDVSARMTSAWGLLAGKTVKFSASPSGKSCTATTNEAGIARCAETGDRFATDDTVTATFEGAEGSGFLELPSTATAKMQVR